MRAERVNKNNPVDASAVRVPARAPQWVIPAVKALLVVTDVMIAVLAFIISFYLREGDAVFRQTGGFNWSTEFAPYGALLLFVLPIRLLTMKYYDLYRLRGEFSFFEDAVRVFKATAIGSLLIVAAAFLYRGGLQFRAFSYARTVFVLDFFLALSAYGFVRLMARSAQTFARRRDVNLIPTLVVGRGPEAALCISEMRERPTLGYRVIGVVENGPLGRDVPDTFEGVPVVSDLKGLPEAIRESGANEVIITDPQVPGDALFDVMMRCGRRPGVEFRIAPSLFNFLPRKTEIDQIGAMPMIRLFRSPLSNAARLVKRASDIIIASLALLLLSPFWLVVALLIKLDSRGPVFYKQERVGMDGRLFLFYKFRTMRTGADDAAHREYLKQYIAGETETNLGDEQKPVYKLRGDKRITRLGGVLRRLESRRTAAALECPAWRHERRRPAPADSV